MKVAKRDGGLCFRFAYLKDWPPRACTGVGLDLHHIVPRSRPFLKLWHVSNLIILCPSCHQFYGQNKLFREACLRKLEELYGYEYRNQPVFKEYVN